MSDTTLDAIEAAYRAGFDAYCSVANAILHDRDAARDAVQDAFATAVRRRERFRGEGPIEAWLWRIVVNSAKTAATRRTQTGMVTLPGAGGEAVAAGAVADVQLELARLPERQRLALFLRYYADLDYRTIAEVLDVAPGTVGATINAAHGTLRRRLAEVFG
jgi:RNA polymerase sigma-70 factor, ECF subfamily